MERVQIYDRSKKTRIDEKGWYSYTDVFYDNVIDHCDIRNKIKAIRELGITYFYNRKGQICRVVDFEKVTERYDGEEVGDNEMLNTAIYALSIMHCPPTEENLKLEEWKKAQICMAMGTSGQWKQHIKKKSDEEDQPIRSQS